MADMNRRQMLGIVGGAVAVGVGSGVLGFASSTPAADAYQATEPEKGFAWTPRKLPDIHKVRMVARERFYHNGWG
ncbi:MAG: hypothetical protein FWH34_06100 [Desulfovibrionaceae bacterium]|nr:hypothetical protein [Desulfovibrionaceae bacterium]